MTSGRAVRSDHDHGTGPNGQDQPGWIGEALADGEILPAGEGRYYSRSYAKDTARSEERTVVATSNCTSLRANASMTAAFSAGASRPWTSPTRRSGSAATSVS